MMNSPKGYSGQKSAGEEIRPDIASVRLGEEIQALLGEREKATTFNRLGGGTAARVGDGAAQRQDGTPD
ncbi:hypothetical protein U1Q18_035647 [Sarracenia purpurea var. burkii]